MCVDACICYCVWLFYVCVCNCARVRVCHVLMCKWTCVRASGRCERVSRFSVWMSERASCVRSNTVKLCSPLSVMFRAAVQGTETDPPLQWNQRKTLIWTGSEFTSSVTVKSLWSNGQRQALQLAHVAAVQLRGSPTYPGVICAEPFFKSRRVC